MNARAPRHGGRQMSVKENQQPGYRLRKVVERQVLRQFTMPDWRTPFEFEVDVLECGHALGTARDLYGYTYPARRRCFECMGDRPALGTLLRASVATPRREGNE